jgi:ketosteroid isomerase-like protein
MSASPLDLAARFFAAIEAGDVATVEALYHEDARVWHNHDRVEQTRAENMAVLRWMVRNLKGLRYAVTRREALPDGFVQTHVLHATLPDGRPFELPACIIATVRDGRITRLEEWLDGASLPGLTAG